MAIELNIYPFTPIIKGTYPQATPLGEICLQNLISHDDKKEENNPRLLGLSIGLIMQFIYTLFFYWRVRRYVKGYGPKLCAIGKYKRNCETLKTTTCSAILGCCFPNFSYIFRDVITRSDRFARFVAQFLFVDTCIDLFYTSLFFFYANEDIPNMEETPRRIIFYVSRPTKIEPRRQEGSFSIMPCINGINSTSSTLESAPSSRTCVVKPSDFEIPMVRATRNERRVTLYHATFQKKVPKDQNLKGPTVKVPKVTQVRPYWSEEDQVKKQEKQQKDIVSLAEKENNAYDATERDNAFQRGDFVQTADKVRPL